jgi:hypothetical protein
MDPLEQHQTLAETDCAYTFPLFWLCPCQWFSSFLSPTKLTTTNIDVIEMVHGAKLPKLTGYTTESVTFLIILEVLLTT